MEKNTPIELEWHDSEPPHQTIRTKRILRKLDMNIVNIT